MPDQPDRATSTSAAQWRLVFGYRHVSGVPHCPCADPGNYLSMEQSTTDPFDVRLTCWCGRTVKGRMESQAELDSFLKQGDTR